MKYVRSYNSFKDNKNFNNINEEFLGGLFKSIGNKLSLGFSKMFGSASQVDKLMEEYKKNILVAWTKKKDALLNLGKLVKEEKNSGEERKEDISKLVKNLQTVTENYEKEKVLIKKKFEIQFNEILKNEKNEKIKYYINIKKIEMEQDLLKQESDILLVDSGLSDEDIKGNQELSNLMKGISDKINQSEELKKEQVNSIESESGEESKFDMEAALKDMENYGWKDSKYTKDYKFEAGEEILFFSKANAKEPKDEQKDSEGKYKGTVAYVTKDQPLEGDPNFGRLQIVTDVKNVESSDGSFTINKNKVISTKKDQEALAKKEEDKKKEEESKSEDSIN